MRTRPLLYSQRSIWKINFQSQEFSWRCRTPRSHPPTLSPSICQMQIKQRKRKVKSWKYSPSKRCEHSLCPSLMSLCLKSSWWGTEEQNRWQVFVQEVYVILSPWGVICLDIICSLLRTDSHTDQRSWLPQVPWSINNVCNHEEYSPHMAGADAVVSSWGLWWF